jgi:hypothetical protein
VSVEDARQTANEWLDQQRQYRDLGEPCSIEAAHDLIWRVLNALGLP